MINGAWLAPSRQEMVVRLNYVLTFLEENLKRFAEYKSYWQTHQPDGEERIAEKITSEAAWLMLLCRRISDLPSETMERLNRIAYHLNSLIRNEANLVLAMRNPQFASAFAIAHFALSDVGKFDPMWDRIVRAALETKGFDTKERYPYRILERLWVQSLYGYAASVSEQEVAILSILHGDAHPITMTESDAYAYTHAPMYLTDFGRKSLPCYLNVARIRAVTDACIAWQIIQRNYDLLGEFLVAALLANKRPSAYFALGFSLFLATWDELGFLPGPGFDQATYARLTGGAKSAYTFAELYHTNLIAGLICAVWLSTDPGDVSYEIDKSLLNLEALLKQVETIVGAAERFCTVSPGEGPHSLEEITHAAKTIDLALAWGDALRGSGFTRTPGWYDSIVATSIPERVKLTILLDGLAILGIRQYDLGLLQRSLALSVDQGLIPTATFATAVDFLSRQQLPSGAIGAYFLSAEAQNSPEAIIITNSFAACLQTALDSLYRGEINTLSD